jgi:hypothetical protein
MFLFCEGRIVMKIGGTTVTPPSEEILVIPRDPDPIVFKAKPLADLDAFEALCPAPKAPGKLTPKGWEPNPEDKGYGELLVNHVKQKVGYMVIHTLAPSEIEWETVNIDNPKTWSNWETDLKNAGLLQAEVNLVGNLVMECNYMTEAKLSRAREAFQRGRELEQKGS